MQGGDDEGRVAKRPQTPKAEEVEVAEEHECEKGEEEEQKQKQKAA